MSKKNQIRVRREAIFVKEAERHQREHEALIEQQRKEMVKDMERFEMWIREAKQKGLCVVCRQPLPEERKQQ